MAKHKKPQSPKPRSIVAFMMICRTGNHAGPHKNQAYEEAKG